VKNNSKNNGNEPNVQKNIFPIENNTVVVETLVTSVIWSFKSVCKSSVLKSVLESPNSALTKGSDAPTAMKIITIVPIKVTSLNPFLLFDNFIFCGYSNVSDEPYSRFLLNSPQYSLQSTFYSLFPHGSVIKL